MNKSCAAFLLIFLCFTYPASCFAQSFTDVAGMKGINHISSGFYGSGLSFVDFNMDGWDDLTMGTTSGDSIVFYENSNGSFHRIRIPGIDNTTEVKQLLWVDFDNDGDKDLFVAARNEHNKLYEQLPNFTFKDITIAAGLPPYLDETFCAAFGDINNDGFLDLYVANYNHTVHTNYMFLNNKRGGFIDITAASGASDSIRFSFAAVFIDVNNDGYLDLYVGNDKVSRNSLYLNNKNNTFTDISVASNTDILMDAMGIAVGDYNGDLLPDFYVSNTFTGNILLENDSNQVFTDVSVNKNATVNALCWGVNFLDYDNDADLDLYVCSSDIGFANKLLRNDNTNFVNSMANPRGDTLESFGNAIGDIDNDGFPDIAVANNTQNSFLLRNSGNANNWIKVELEGTVSNRDGIGSKIEVFTANHHSITYTHCGIGFQAQNSNQYIIGLENANNIDSLIVTWLSGHRDAFFNLSPNQKLTIVEGSKLKIQAKLQADTNSICSGDSLEIRLENPFKKYYWSTGDSTTKITVKEAGMYYAVVENQFGISIETDTLVIDTFPNSLSLKTSFFPATNSALNNGKAVVEVDGGHPPIYIIWDDPNYQLTDTAFNLEVGTYKVVVRDSKGCFKINKGEVGRLNGWNKTVNEADLFLFPSPSIGMVNVQVPAEAKPGEMYFELFDLTGNRVANRIFQVNTQVRQFALDLSNLPEGLYLTVMRNSSQLYTGKIEIVR